MTGIGNRIYIRKRFKSFYSLTATVSNSRIHIKISGQEGIISRNAGAGTPQPTVERKPKKKREDGLRQAEKMLLTWLISDRDRCL